MLSRRFLVSLSLVLASSSTAACSATDEPCSGDSSCTESALGARGGLPAPFQVRAFVGGNDVALRWSGDEGPSVAGYNVYRDGALIGSTSRSRCDVSIPETHGMGFIDRNVAHGATYRYQVQAVGGDGRSSELSPAI